MLVGHALVCLTESAHASETWKKASILGIGGILVPLAAYELYLHNSHHHEHHEPVKYAYRKIRVKAYPWECSDCNLFDAECKKQWRATHGGAN